jgi:hypothetical protein
MPKQKISEFSATPANNTDIDSINIAEGCAPSGINDAIRELMAQLKDFQVGSAGDPVTVGGVLTVQAGAVGTPAITTAGDTNTGIFFPAADTIAFAEGGAEAMRLDSSGNLGLGVTPSANTVGKSLDIVGGMGLFAEANNTYLTTNAYYDSAWKYKATDHATYLNQTDGAFKFFTAPSGTAGNAITFTQAMTLDASGNLGIGTTSPARKLEVQGSTGYLSTFRNNSATATTSYINVINANNVNAGLVMAHIDDGTGYIGTQNNAALRFVTNDTERARIDSSGNLLVGTTSAGGRLTVVAGSATQSPITTSSVTGDTIYQAILVSKFDNNSTTSQNFIQFQINNGGANCGKITANGANTAAFGSTSDQRVKENITQLPSQLANIMALRPVEFDYLESYGGGHQIGFIAQEMQQVYPDVIAEDASEEKILSITGWSKTEARLVKAMQEQQAIIESLTTRITALEGQ